MTDTATLDMQSADTQSPGKKTAKPKKSSGEAATRLPNMAYLRSFEVSDGVMTAGIGSDDGLRDEKPVEIRVQRGRCTANFVGEKKKASAGANETVNLFNIEATRLDLEHDTLQVAFSLTALPCALKHYATSDLDMSRKLDAWVGAQDRMFYELAFLYAQNIASGVWLWRNRDIAYQIEVQVTDNLDGRSWNFVPLSVLPDKDARAKLAQPELMPRIKPFGEFEGASKDDLLDLAQVMGNALAGKTRLASFSVVARVIVQKGAEVYPSQEMTMSKAEKGAPTRLLYRVRGDHRPDAGLHARKIANALRQIDLWHGEAEEVGPLAVELFAGSLTYQKNFRSNGTVYKKGESNGCYAILHRLLVEDGDITPEESLFVLACLVRGALFTLSEDKE